MGRPPELVEGWMMGVILSDEGRGTRAEESKDGLWVMGRPPELVEGWMMGVILSDEDRGTRAEESKDG